MDLLYSRWYNRVHELPVLCNYHTKTGLVPDQLVFLGPGFLIADFPFPSDKMFTIVPY